MELINRTECSGCTACANICPQKCINMEADNEGFLYPQIIDFMCSDCGLCREVCPIGKIEKHSPFYVYAVKNKDNETKLKSTSGAMFTAISDFVFANKGVVFGCKFDEELNAVHDFAETKEELHVFRGTKYVQSILADTFRKVEEFLIAEKMVLFTGTPCQVAGLSAYLGKEYDNLIKCDLVCQSVPSPKAVQAFVKELEGKNNSKVRNLYFREKKLDGWTKSNLRVDFENGHIHRESLYGNVFMKGFNKGLFSRPSCANCSYKDFKGNSDITIADYWGIEKVAQDFADNLGVSLVFINTEKGVDIFSKINSKLNYIETKVDESILENPHVVVPSAVHKNRNEFFKNIDSEKFSDLVKKLVD